MNRSLIGWIAAAVLAVGGAGFAYLFWFAGGSGEPSTELTTPELADTTTTTSDDSEVSTTLDETDTSTTAGGGAVAFVIDPDQSTARFEIDEVLRGEPTHVVGTTNQVAGQVSVDPKDLSTAEFSEMVVNARTFETGSGQRDRAIRGPVILDSASDEHELITFTVTSVDGLDGSLAAGETVEFTISGDLTVKGTTQPVTFDASVSMIDEMTIGGTAEAQITRDMFEIGIPSVPGVADVTNEVLIGLDFVAVAG
jgi:polyisoprenoid-binding protein YceI